MSSEEIDSPPVSKRPKLDIEGSESSGKTTESVSDVRVTSEVCNTGNTSSDPPNIYVIDGQSDSVKLTTSEYSTDSRPFDKSEAEEQESVSTERDVGITEYISQPEGFGAVIKQRYSDFLVNEIDMSGNTVHLTSHEVPCAVPDLAEQDVKDVSDVISAEDIENLSDLMKSKDKSRSVQIQVDEDKSARARIHQAVKEGFPGLDSKTIVQGDQKVIEVQISTNSGNGLRNWPKGRPDYLSFVLYKENKDTMDTISLIAKQLRVKSGVFQYAGTKDKRAKTSQLVTAYRMTAEKLKANNKNLRNISTGNYQYVKEPLKLGQLSGNRFTIVLRNVTAKDEHQVETAMKSLRDVGFINYYGMQRFGTTSVPTHHIGRALLRSEWQEAVELILKPRSTDDGKVSAVRKKWWVSRDSQEALHTLPLWCSIERNVLQGLVQHGKANYKNALNKIARNTRLMYVHSYQSYIWNTMVSKRFRELGLEPQLGDLFLPSDSQTEVEGDETDSERRERLKPQFVTAENIQDVRLQDLVLPLPGYDVIYPENEVKQWYEELMARDGLDMDNMRHSTKDYSLSGAYRKVVVQPRDLAWQLVRYNDVTLPLALSDLDKLSDTAEPQSVPDGKFLALKLELSLPTSCYATMAVREVLKSDTSAAHQSTLNVT